MMGFRILTHSLVLAGLWFAATAMISAQEIRGRVSDGEARKPLVGATIRVFAPDTATPGAFTSTELGAISQEDGHFLIRGPVRDTVRVVVTYIGYESWTLDWWPGAGEVLATLNPADALSPEVEITAARRSRSVEDACCRVESIQEEVQQHAPFAPSATDVLRRYSSCTSMRIACAIENTGTIRLRGLEPTYVSLRLDGMPAFTGLGAIYGLSLVPAHALQTIRISEGASSALYGNGAVSGVVDLETRPPTEVSELLGSWNLAGDGFETPGQRDLNASYTGMVGDVGLAAFGSYNDHQIDPKSGWGYRRASGLLKGNMLLNDATELNVMALGGFERRDGSFPAIDAQSLFNESSDIGRMDLSARLARTLDDESELTGSVLYSLMSVDHRTNDATPFDARQQLFYATLKYNTSLGDHLLQVGSEFRHDRMSERSGPGLGYSITIPSLFLQDEYLLGDMWTVLGSLRLDQHSQAGTILSPRGSIRFAPEANLTMRLMAGQGFKGEALFNEEHLLLHGLYDWRSNPDFNFERSWTLNYDINYSFLIGDIAGIDANFNTYYTLIDGKAVPNPDSLAAGTLFYINSDQPTRLTGMELQIRPTFGEHWSGSLAFALINYAMRQTDGSYQQITLAPRANLDASILYHDEANGFSAEAWGSYIGQQRLPLNPAGLSESPAYTLLNMRVEKTFGPVSIFAGTFNLLDIRQEQTMPLAFISSNTGEQIANGSVVWGPLEGREFFAGARLRIEFSNN
jgi:outer membrane receptor for ferrienterochelin and colicins